MQFTMNHANLNVTDLDKSLAFYDEALGMKVIRRRQAEDGSFELAFLGDGVAACQLELTWLRDKQGPYELGDNESHICWVAEDFEAAHELHAQMSCICYENTGMGLYFIEDPDGYWLEIVPSRKR